jgi:putative ABC transport system permease protein
MVDVALRILLHDKLRFAMTAAGVAFAVTLVLVQMGLFLGILDNASITIERCEADLWVTSHGAAYVDGGQPFPASYLQRVRSVPGVARADNLIVWFTRLNLASGATELTLTYALENFGRWNLPWKHRDAAIEDLRRGNFVFLDESARRRFGGFKRNEYREFLGRRMRIIGETEEVLSFTTTPVSFMDLHVLQALDPMNLSDRTVYILVKLAPGADAQAVQAEIRRRLPHNDVHTREAWAALSRDYWLKTTGLGLNMFVTVFLGLLVGVVVVAQTSTTSTMEHFKEFAMVKAMGGGNADVYSILVEQSAIAALVGFAIGAALTALARPFILRLGLKMIVPPAFFLIVLAGTVLMCVGASLLSYRRIAHADPALVFRS